MARISLREYVHEIETLIDRGDTQKAIAHCKHILRFFPKHIDTYRLFGKALLELQKYGDASDIFTRVLSSVPDDFISQIGMSIIREDENNLDAAIWHLERAFEIQPSNKAVQDELKRLYSSRDGVTPTKIRLTRGALVRMYARGELFPQAIAEINAALLEDPNRVDLEVILARLYFMLDQKIEATETCSSLIAKLPFCYEANRILAALLPGTSRDEDAKIFKQRVVDLDPYFDFVSENTPNPIDIPDNKVMMEFLDYVPGMETQEQQQPDWAKSIGIDWESDTKGESSQIESWLNSEAELKTEKEPDKLEEKTTDSVEKLEKIELDDFAKSSEFVISTKDTPENLNTEKYEDIPKWMAEAGWTTSEIIDETAQKGFNLEIPANATFPADNSDEIQPGTIPDWIQKLAPKDVLETEDAGVESPIDDRSFDSLFMDEAMDQENKEQLPILSDNTWKREFPFDDNNLDENFIEESSEIVSEVNPYDDIKISYENNEFSEEQQVEIVKAFENIQDEIENQKLESNDDSITGLAIDLEKVSNPNEDERQNLEDAYLKKELSASDQIDDKLEELSPEKIQGESETIIEKPLEEPEAEMDWLHGLIHEEENPELVSTDELQMTELPLDSFLDQTKVSPQSEEHLEDFSWLNALQTDLNIEENKAEQGPEAITNREDEESLPIIASEFSIEELVSNVSKNQPEVDDLQFEKESSLAEIDDLLLQGEMNSDEIEAEPVVEDVFVNAEFPSEITAVLPEMNKDISEEELQPERENNIIGEESIVSDFDVTTISLEEKSPDWIESLINEIPDEPADISISEPEFSETMRSETYEAKVNNEEESEEETEIGAALAWMEGLAAKHGATEETLTYKPGDRNNTPPDWIKALQEDADSVKQSETNNELSAASEMFADEDLTPSWLQELQLESLDEDAKDILPPDFQEDSETEMQILLDETDQIESIQSGTEIKNEFGSRIEATANTIDVEEKMIASTDLEKVTEENISANDSEIESHVLSQDLISENEKFEEQEQLITAFIPQNEIPEIKEPVIVSEDVEITSSRMLQDDSILGDQILDGKLEEGKSALQKGNIDMAVSIFNSFIKSKDSIDEIIVELQTALDHNFPINISLWQTLGDAYLRKNQLKNALDAYSKAEELLL
ncbi:MAG: hypothetical protein CVU46_08985 [Chloroflexi bacterium HGW-Chloroflexi-8]|nr:MAG: hypothetical protein CVU46_08985 [Chloroflexi bacterium HGW-Chloroflexi-8]